MAKKIILVLTILIVIACVFAFFIPKEQTINVFIDGENVTVETDAQFNKDPSLNEEICDYTLDVMNDTTSNVTTLREGIQQICEKYGIENPKIIIDSSIGENQIPIIVYVDGTSMLPTLQDGQLVLLNKTKDVHVGDIVVADSDEYGVIIKRVEQIDGDEIYLVSDNKNVNYEYDNGILYEVKGITTWVGISDINGVVIEY